MFGNLPKTTQLIKQQDSSLQGPSLGLFLYLLKMGLKKKHKKEKNNNCLLSSIEHNR